MRRNFLYPASMPALSVGLVTAANAQVFDGAAPGVGVPATGPFVATGPGTAVVTGDTTGPTFVQTTTTTTTTPGTVDVTDTASDSTLLLVDGNLYGASVNTSTVATNDVNSVTVTNADYTIPGPPVVANSSSLTATGGSSVSSFSVSGSAGVANTTGGVIFGSNIVDTGPISGNTTSVQENDIRVTTSGATFSTYTGTATYDPVTGTSIAMNGTPVAETTYGANGLAINTGVALTGTGLDNGGNVISNVADGVAATDAATVGQVSAGDAATLASANAYTDTSVAAEAAARVAGDAATLASANTYTDTSVATEAAARVAGDAATLASANTFTTTSVATEAAARVAGDAATLSSANTYTNTQVAAEATARLAADTAEAAARIAGDNAIRADLTAETNARLAMGSELRDRIASSTATAIALGGTTILPDSNFTLAGNVGFYQGAQALALNAAARIAPNVYATGAVGGGLNKHGEIGGRVGFVFGF